MTLPNTTRKIFAFVTMSVFCFGVAFEATDSAVRAAGFDAPISREPASAFSWSGLAFAALVLPLFGVFMLNAEVRARYHLWRKERAHAARVYESLLARHPYRVKYLPKLARIYLQEGRRDESAMKVYRTVLQLNLAGKECEEINTLVAHQFLNEGRTDSDAIEVLEKQLAVEMNRKKLTLERTLA